LKCGEERYDCYRAGVETEVCDQKEQLCLFFKCLDESRQIAQELTGLEIGMEEIDIKGSGIKPECLYTPERACQRYVWRVSWNLGRGNFSDPEIHLSRGCAARRACREFDRRRDVGITTELKFIRGSPRPHQPLVEERRE
jgi:hypothetical protein